MVQWLGLKLRTLPWTSTNHLKRSFCTSSREIGRSWNTASATVQRGPGAVWTPKAIEGPSHWQVGSWHFLVCKLVYRLLTLVYRLLYTVLQHKINVRRGLAGANPPRSEGRKTRTWVYWCRFSGGYVWLYEHISNLGRLLAAHLIIPLKNSKQSWTSLLTAHCSCVLFQWWLQWWLNSWAMVNDGSNDGGGCRCEVTSAKGLREFCLWAYPQRGEASRVVVANGGTRIAATRCVARNPWLNNLRRLGFYRLGFTTTSFRRTNR